MNTKQEPNLDTREFEVWADVKHRSGSDDQTTPNFNFLVLSPLNSDFNSNSHTIHSDPDVK